MGGNSSQEPHASPDTRVEKKVPEENTPLDVDEILPGQLYLGGSSVAENKLALQVFYDTTRQTVYT